MSKKVLEEEEYVEQLEKIIERDFFPDLPALRKQQAVRLSLYRCLQTDVISSDASILIERHNSLLFKLCSCSVAEELQQQQRTRSSLRRHCADRGRMGSHHLRVADAMRHLSGMNPLLLDTKRS